MVKTHLKLVTPATVKRTVTPKRRANAKLRTREYLTEAEVKRLNVVTQGSRYGHRDATMRHPADASCSGQRGDRIASFLLHRTLVAYGPERSPRLAAFESGVGGIAVTAVGDPRGRV